MFESKIEHPLLENQDSSAELCLSISGRTMRFFSKNGSIDFTIESPRQELIAKLNDGSWFWFNMCIDCGSYDPRARYYVGRKCLKHDVCVSCGKHRSELNQTPHGTDRGFRCNPCQTILDENVKNEALRKAAEKEWNCSDHTDTSDIFCPHCASEINSDEHYESVSKLICDVCQGEFSLEVEHNITYSTKVIGERITYKGDTDD